MNLASILENTSLEKRIAITPEIAKKYISLGFEVQRNRTMVRDSLGIERKGGVTDLNFRNNLYMMFKNLPLSYLFIIIPTRLILDGIASITFLGKNKGIRHLFAVIKAHFSFYFEIPKLIAKRRKIYPKSSLIGKMKYSILVKSLLTLLMK